MSLFSVSSQLDPWIQSFGWGVGGNGRGAGGGEFGGAGHSRPIAGSILSEPATRTGGGGGLRGGGR